MDFTPIDLRNALGRFATGVCVITAAPAGFAPFGMTINSFASVSLEPPLILWSLQNDSDCAPAFAAADRFAVNILTADQMAISQQYSRRNDHDLRTEHVRDGSTGLPVIRDSLASFECEMWQRYDGGDHVILVGRVLALHDAGNDAKPLLFFGGRYQELR
jgi:flavin reductase (DIM6/NTAB) family NADH-FMN oxidoreductase RutF